MLITSLNYIWHSVEFIFTLNQTFFTGQLDSISSPCMQLFIAEVKEHCHILPTRKTKVFLAIQSVNNNTKDGKRRKQKQRQKINDRTFDSRFV